MDLLSALAHEFGHVLGLEHADERVMAETLADGVRTASIHDQIFATEVGSWADFLVESATPRRKSI